MRVVTYLAQESDIETQHCPLHLTINTPRGLIHFTMPFIVAPWGRPYYYNRAEDAGGKSWQGSHLAAQRIGIDGARTSI